MKNPELYHKTFDILVAAYFNDTLNHGDCTACAVANILSDTARNVGVPVRRWANAFATFANMDGTNPEQLSAGENELVGTHWLFGPIVHMAEDSTQIAALKECRTLLAASPYPKEDLMKIEWAFETAARGNSEDEYMFNGLMAVIEVLDQIHENTDETITTNTKKRFTCNLPQPQA